MSAAEAAREAAWLETVQSRQPLPSTATRRAWANLAADQDEATIRARRVALLKAFEDKP